MLGRVSGQGYGGRVLVRARVGLAVLPLGLRVRFPGGSSWFRLGGSKEFRVARCGSVGGW